ncbi:HlyC/CorC family transporter [Candidatus Woesearchaeota archaeon]|nr:HlyC/CorC family transporter [Candidatus Woesearchaeota archaeon]
MLFLSAFFSSSEIALISLNKLDVRHLLEKKGKGAETIAKLKKDPHRLLINIAIANNIVNIFATSFATAVAIKLFGSYGVGIATGVMTFLVLTFGEIIPKTLATKNAESIALSVAKPIYLIGIILTPIIKFFDGMTHLITKGGVDKKVTEEEIKTLIAMGEEEGAIEKVEKEMIHNIFTFNDIDVWEVMTPRTEIFALDFDVELKEVISTIKNTGFSRIPIYEKRIDNIKGILYVKDLLSYINHNKPKVKLNEIIRPAFFIPRNKRIDNLLKEFQNRKTHIAIIVDEHGGVEGLVTLEDLLEEIIGEVYDEDDIIERPIRKIDDKTFLIKGCTELDLVNRKLKLNLKDIEKSTTINGLIIDTIGRIPKKGERIDLKKAIAIIEKTEQQRIDEIRLIKK